MSSIEERKMKLCEGYLKFSDIAFLYSKRFTDGGKVNIESQLILAMSRTFEQRSVTLPRAERAYSFLSYD